MQHIHDIVLNALQYHQVEVQSIEANCIHPPAIGSTNGMKHNNVNFNYLITWQEFSIINLPTTPISVNKELIYTELIAYDPKLTVACYLL